jgi:signal transduction histidine kinase
MNEPGEARQKQSAPGLETALCGCMLTGVLVWDAATQVGTLSSEAAQLLGIPPEEGPKVSLSRLPDAISKIVQEALRTGKPSIARQIYLPGQTGSAWAHVTAVPVKMRDDSAVVLTIHALNPATPFLRQVRQLDRLANAGTLAAGLAHEIKNALVAGRTFLDLLLEKNTDQELVEIVRRENGRIDSIVSRMLRFASITTPAFAHLHVHEVLEHALRLVQPQLAASNVVLERALRAQNDTANGDEYGLQQAFVNLLLNALDAISESGILTVSSETSREAATGAGQIRINLKDNGMGISPENMRHLFEPFFTTKAAGTGLGLVITRRIIQEHGGSIFVESRPGQGTTFTVQLPLLPENRIIQPGGSETAMVGRRTS